MTQWNISSNTFANFTVGSEVCYPNRTYHTAFNPTYPNNVQIMTGPFESGTTGQKVTGEDIETMMLVRQL